LFSLYIDPLLCELDPAGTMDHIVAFVDDVNPTPTQRIPPPASAAGVYPPRLGRTYDVECAQVMCCGSAGPNCFYTTIFGSNLLVACNGRLLGVQIFAGRDAEV
jgi:hypothetical protein